MFVPVSIPGCGKSTYFRALLSLFPEWSHVENDKIKSKRELFNKAKAGLKHSAVLLFDRNNHLGMHRKEIFEHLLDFQPLELVALVFVDQNTDKAKLTKIVNERIAKRGDNHATIDGNSPMAKRIVGRFRNELQPLDPAKESDVHYRHRIQLDPFALPTDNLHAILDFCEQSMGVVQSSEDQIHAALKESMGYTVPEHVKAEKRRESRDRGRGPSRGGQSRGSQGRGRKAQFQVMPDGFTHIGPKAGV